MKKHFFIGLLLLFPAFPVPATDPIHPMPTGGILDLREASLDEKSVFNLNGEWTFFWEELITPASFQSVNREGKSITVKVPSYFSNYSINGVSLPGRGYGTYCLTILLPAEMGTTVCFDIPVFDVAYRFYVNDRLAASNGTVGTSPDAEAPWYEPSSLCMPPTSDTLQLLIQVSNFHHRRGGFWKSVFMGGSDGVLERIERRRIYNYTSIGALFFFSLFYMIFWFFSRKQTLMLMFALTTLGILIRSVNTGLYFSNSFAFTPWSWQIRMEYLGTYLAYIFGMIFLHRLFPAGYMNRVIRINTLLFTVAILSLLILPVRYFSYEMLLFQPLILLFLGHYLVRSLIGMIRRRFVDTVFFIALSFFIYAMVNDIMLANTAGAIHNSYLSQLAFELFIFSMAVLIIMEWVKNDHERLKLEASLRFKNKVLSVIAHDLKNPVASVAQFSDLLVSRPELAGREKILQSLKESSQAAVTLLDNLLYWGRSEAEDLKVTPSSLDMEEAIREVESLFRHLALQKELKFTTDVRKGTVARADRVLVHIVIRNLVSNAIKFTPRNGSVHVRAYPDGGVIRVSVQDTGQGISSEQLQRYNEKGGLDPTQGTDAETGTGLGLRLVRDLVERSGGVLTIESVPGKGSTFVFTLPELK